MVRFKTLKHKKIEIVMHLVQDCDQGLLLKLHTYATNSTTTNDKFVHSSKKSANSTNATLFFRFFFFKMV